MNICEKLMGSCCSSISNRDPQRFFLGFPFFIFVNISSSHEKPDSLSLITYFFNQFTFGFKVTNFPIIVASSLAASSILPCTVFQGHGTSESPCGFLPQNIWGLWAHSAPSLSVSAPSTSCYHARKEEEDVINGEMRT